MLEVKVTGLLMFSTPQVTDHTDFSFSRVEKKVKPHVVSCLTSPLTKNKQEHPKNPVSLLLGLSPLQSGSGVNAVQPFYAPTAARSRQESTHEGGI